MTRRKVLLVGGHADGQVIETNASAITAPLVHVNPRPTHTLTGLPLHSYTESARVDVTTYTVVQVGLFGRTIRAGLSDTIPPDQQDAAMLRALIRPEVLALLEPTP